MEQQQITKTTQVESKGTANQSPSKQPFVNPNRQFQHMVGNLGNQAIQKFVQAKLKTNQTPVIQRCACGGSCPSCQAEREKELFIQTKLRIGAPNDIYEQEADRVADTVMRIPESQITEGATVSQKVQPFHTQRFRSTHHTPIGEEQEERTLQAKGAPNGFPETTSKVESYLNTSQGSGQPLPESTRTFMESRFGNSFNNVRIHADAQAASVAHELNAQAFTHGQDIYFGAGRYQPNAAFGQQLLAHELTHILQQTQNKKYLIQRDLNGVESSGQGNSSSDMGDDTGPCEIDVHSLTNGELLFQLNLTRVYLTQHTWGEDETYDYANLLRRASQERRRRIHGGHVWMVEPGLLQPPETLYALRAGNLDTIQVEQISGSSVAGNPESEYHSIVTQTQFERFLALQHIPVIDPSEYFANQDPESTNPLNVSLSPEPRTTEIPEDFASLYRSDNTMSPSVRHLATSMPYKLSIPKNPFSSTRNPIEQPPFIHDFFGSDPLEGNTEGIQYIPLAISILSELNSEPGWVRSPGSERVFLPNSPSSTARSASLSEGLLPTMVGPEGVGALGFLGRPNYLPEGATGILWQGHHVSDVAVLNGRAITRGFRASLFRHVRNAASSRTSRVRAQLNVGVPGSYTNDSPFAFGEVLPSVRHWRNGSVIIIAENAMPDSAANLIEVMAQGVSDFEGQEYRFSLPEEPQLGSDDYEASRSTYDAVMEAANAEAQRRGQPQFCPRGAQMCVNLPVEIHQQALGGANLTFTNSDGVVINLADPAQANAPNMSEFMDKSDSFFEERGLRKIRVGPHVWAGLGIAAGLGVGGSLANSALRISHGEDLPYREIATNAGVEGFSSVGSAFAEEYAHTALTTRLTQTGLSGRTASVLSRGLTSTGVALIAVPITTGLEMAFDDRPYTRIDYAARMGRSGISGAGGAAGGALATGIYFSLAGSEVPLVGNAIGFLAGIGFYYLTDSLAGNEIEEGIRVGLGELGCTD